MRLSGQGNQTKHSKQTTRFHFYLPKGKWKPRLVERFPLVSCDTGHTKPFEMNIFQENSSLQNYKIEYVTISDEKE